MMRLWSTVLAIAAMHGPAAASLQADHNRGLPTLDSTGLAWDGMYAAGIAHRHLQDATTVATSASADCGGVGRRACATDFPDNGGCRPGLEANKDTICLPDLDLPVFPCALDGQRCCLGTCARNLNCNAEDRCVRCGGLNEPVCTQEGPPCVDGLLDVDGECTSEPAEGLCGGTGMQCCGGDVCMHRNTCDGGRCRRCGGRRQGFCAEELGCNGRLRVENGTCERVTGSADTDQPDCGKVGEAVCTTGRGCDDGLQAYNSRCVPALNNRRPCGVEGQACCVGRTCPRSLECQENICARPAIDTPAGGVAAEPASPAAPAGPNAPRPRGPRPRRTRVAAQTQAV